MSSSQELNKIWSMMVFDEELLVKAEEEASQYFAKKNFDDGDGSHIPRDGELVTSLVESKEIASSARVALDEEMVYFDIKLYHKGYFGYKNGKMRYFGEELLVGDFDSDFWCVFEAEDQLSEEAVPNGPNEVANVVEEAAPDGNENEPEAAEAADGILGGGVGAAEAGAGGVAQADITEEFDPIVEAEASGTVATNKEAGTVGDNARDEQDGEGEDNIEETSMRRGDDESAGLEEHDLDDEDDVAGGIGSEGDDSEDEEYVSSEDNVDSAQDVHFTDSEEE
ncbi:hypothetical protein PIB30_100428 [Stylosanthes scabra]|uniref:Uncharacterized protein n=1 Tax=Stylosanthes scabra TaxID=79078 RepID=A0ABU6VVW3_9FABA|nr:hypothetical protein [Stylosanthes scabra]